MGIGVWLDARLMHFAAAHRTGWVTDGARALMEVGTSVAVLAVAVLTCVALVVARRGYRPAAAVLLAVVASTAAVGVLKQTFDRARPPADLALVHLSGAAMPSTHAARTAAAAAAVLVATTWTTPRVRLAWAFVLTACVVLIGLCLVYLGVHWPTDVVAGWAVGVAVGSGAGLLCHSLFRRSSERRSVEPG